MYIVYIQKPRLLSHDPVKYYLSGIERYLKNELLNFLIYENIQRVNLVLIAIVINHA